MVGRGYFPEAWAAAYLTVCFQFAASTSGAKASTSYTRTYRNATATASTSTAAAATATSAATTASASASVEPEPEDDHDDGDGEFQLTGRNYRKKGRKQQKRKSGSVGPKKPVFDHSKILELPADVLCTILSHLPLENRMSGLY